MIYIKRFNLCFVEIPKTASQSIRSAFFKSVVDWNEDTISGLSSGDIHKIHSNSRYIIRNNLAPSNAKFIGVIREPLERQLSAYIYCWWEHHTANKERYRHYRIDNRPNPNHFLEIYTKEPRNDGRPYFWEFMGKAGSESQSSYINPGLNHEFWLYDDLETHFENFKQEYDIDPTSKLEVINKSSKDPEVTTKSLIDKFYNDELKDIMKRIYADDFKLYDELKNGRIPR
jgi:hypothetical protein